MKKLLSILFVCCACIVYAQQNGNFKSIRLVNVSDSSTILPVNSTIYYNEQTKRLKVYVNDEWYTLIDSNGNPGSNNLHPLNIAGKTLYSRGNSVTNGSGTSNTSIFSFPKILANLYQENLNEMGVGSQKAQTYASTHLGDTPPYLPSYHFITFEWGINDLAAGRSALEFVTDMDTIIQDAIDKGWPREQIIVLSIPGSWTNGNQTNIQTYNAATLNKCSALGVNFVDVYNPFLTASPGIDNYRGTDGTHPNNEGAALIALVIYGQIKSPFTNTGRTISVSGDIAATSFHYFSPPFLNRSNLLGVDSTGTIGSINQLPRGTMTNQTFTINGSVIQSGALGVLPSGFGNSDFALNYHSGIWGTFNVNTTYGNFFPFDSDGVSRFNNNYAGFDFEVGSIAGTPSQKFRITNTLTTSSNPLLLNAGTSTAGTAPIKIPSGTLLGTTEAGAIENNGTHLYYTAANAGTRYQLDQQSGGAGASGLIQLSNGSGGLSASALTGTGTTISAASTLNLSTTGGSDISLTSTNDINLTPATSRKVSVYGSAAQYGQIDASATTANTVTIAAKDSGSANAAVQILSSVSGTTTPTITFSNTNSGTTVLRIIGIPTSSAGLPSGSVYSNAGVLTIVP